MQSRSTEKKAWKMEMTKSRRRLEVNGGRNWGTVWAEEKTNGVRVDSGGGVRRRKCG